FVLGHQEIRSHWLVGPGVCRVSERWTRLAGKHPARIGALTVWLHGAGFETIRRPRPPGKPEEERLSATIIDGKPIAAELRTRVGERAAEFRKAKGIEPGLAVVLAGDDPASRLYVDSKGKQATAVGIRSFDYRLPSTVTTAELYRLIDELNARADVHGILVQLPLP